MLCHSFRADGMLCKTIWETVISDTICECLNKLHRNDGIFASPSPRVVWVFGYVYFYTFLTTFEHVVDLNASNSFCLPTNILDFLIWFLRSLLENTCFKKAQPSSVSTNTTDKFPVVQFLKKRPSKPEWVL